jgi:O-antigen biosynthesis protein
MRVAWITNDFAKIDNTLHPGGCAYYRCMLPKGTIGNPEAVFGRPAWTGMHGYGVRVSADTARFGFDVVVMKQMMQRWVPYEMEIAKKLGQKLIVDIDDHYDGLHEDNLAYRTTDPAKNKISNREYHNQVIELADTVVVSTPFLFEYYKDKGVRDVRLVRNGINPEQFDKRKHSTMKPVLGWVGAMHWRSGDIETLRPWLGDFLEEHDLMFHHAGHMPDAKLFWDASGINPDRVLLSPMQVISEYHNMFLMDIGLVPLNDIEFNHAKSTIKGLEYAASNIPFIAQATPEYSRLASLGVGRVANTPDEWVKHATELLDYNVRKREAAVQRARALNEHSMLVRKREWDQMFAGFHNVAPIRSFTVPYGVAS